MGSWGAVASSPWDPRRGGEWRKEAKEVDVSQRPTCRGNDGGGGGGRIKLAQFLGRVSKSWPRFPSRNSRGLTEVFK